MIYGKIDQLYRALKPEAVELISAFLATAQHLHETGEKPLNGEEVYAKILRYETSHDNNNMVEAHNQYVDIQFLLQGTERIEVYDRPKLTTRTAYSSHSDCEFFYPHEDAHLGTVMLKPGYFAVFFPEDAHLAALNPAGEVLEVNKIVIKIYEKYFA
ncbi:YhcH/YjgK/YiaL family protein [Hufsiella ginkgonis]|uniref:DUF386 family protein n=1 Tax=Hufsiella ginkgonis TaxID=2695274 RepID=A0A7K1Y2F1_9SPHI|nr:YhcH/YjgK/YiaL family protein [Hufsiella ginkgonis]MXV17421.1 DUF386 family protein [Hufsiella ginkgonis]